MAEQASENISKEAMRVLVGDVLSGGGLRSICNSGNINPYSWYRSRPIQLDSDLLCELAPAPTTDRKLGDFRRYDHLALTPGWLYNSTPANTFNYGPGTSVTTFAIQAKPERMNLYELSANDPMYLKIDYYASSSDRSSEINLVRSFTTSTNILSTEDGKGGKDQPPGHTNDQLKSPTSSMILLSDTGFDPTDWNQPDDTIYIDCYIVNSGGTRIIRLGETVADSYFDIDIHEYQAPFIDASGPFITPVPKVNVGAGDVTFTFLAVKITNSSSGFNGADFAESNGSTSYGGAGFYWYIYGLAGSNYYRIGNRDVTAQLQIPSKTSTTIFNSTLNNAGGSSNQNSSGTLSGGENWSWDDEGDIVITSVDWDASTVLTPGSNEVHDLGTTAPT